MTRPVSLHIAAAVSAVAGAGAFAAMTLPVHAQDSSSDGARAAGGLLALFGFSVWSMWMCCVGLVVLLSLLGTVLWVWMLVDLVQRPQGEFPEGQTQVLWIVLLLVTGVIGGALYYFMVYRKLGPARAAASTPADTSIEPPSDEKESDSTSDDEG